METSDLLTARSFLWGQQGPCRGYCQRRCNPHLAPPRPSLSVEVAGGSLYHCKLTPPAGTATRCWEGRRDHMAGLGGRCRRTLSCTRIQRQYRACLHRRDARPSSSLPVVALMTSTAESPTVQLTLKLGAFPGCRASALLMPGRDRQGKVTQSPRARCASCCSPEAHCLLEGGQEVHGAPITQLHSTSEDRAGWRPVHSGALPDRLGPHHHCQSAHSQELGCLEALRPRLRYPACPCTPGGQHLFQCLYGGRVWV